MTAEEQAALKQFQARILLWHGNVTRLLEPGEPHECPEPGCQARHLVMIGRCRPPGEGPRWSWDRADAGGRRAFVEAVVIRGGRHGD